MIHCDPFKTGDFVQCKFMSGVSYRSYLILKTHDRSILVFQNKRGGGCHFFIHKQFKSSKVFTKSYRSYKACKPNTMPRRQNRPPTRNPRGLGAAPRNVSPDRSARASASCNRRRSLSESNLPRPAAAETPQAERSRAASVVRGTKALNEIRHLQRSTGLLIPKLPFGRVIREVMLEYSGRHLRITYDALMAIQEAAEMYLVMLFEDCQKLALHRQRVTITKRDMDLALYFRL